MATYNNNMKDVMNNSESESQCEHYVSCMKINGIPLLPPLMTQEYKQEMQYYKKLALAVERRISDLKICMEDDSTLYSNNHPSDTEECFDGTNISYDPQDRSSFSERQSSPTEQDPSEEAGKLDDFFENNDFESMNSQVTIIDMSTDQNNLTQTESTDMSYIKMNDKNKSNNDNVLKLQDVNVSPTLSNQIMIANKEKCKVLESPIKVITNDEEKKDFEKVTTKTKIIRTSSVITRTQPKETFKTGLDNSSSRINTKKNLPQNSPIKIKKTPLHRKENVSPVITAKKTMYKPKDLSMYESKRTLKKTIPTLRHKLSPAKNITGSLNNISSGLASPPRLVRQNSYTLDSPSPLLLAHLEVQSITSGIDVSSISMSDTSKDMPSANISYKSDSYIQNNDDNTMKSRSSTHVRKDSTDSVKNIPRKSSVEQINHKIIDAHWDDYKKLCKSDIQSAQSSPIVNKQRSNNNESDCPIQNEFENKLVSNGIEMLSDMQNKESPGVYFDVILKKFQEDHEKQMTALLRKQQDEQLLLKKTFESQQKLLMDQFQTTFTNSRESSSSRKSDSPQVKNLKTNESVGSESRQSNIQESPRLSKDLSNDDSMEKYLTISADVLNASRSLLINRKTVNLSPTDIQCVNVVPMQDVSPTSSYRSKDSSMRTVYNRNDSTNGSLVLDPNSTSKLYLHRHKSDTATNSNKSYEYYDRGDERPDTARTSNTLDDLNFTFSSDDGGAHVNNYFNDDGRSEYYNTSQEYKRNKDALAKARNKISEIQKNLSCQALGRRSGRSNSDSSFHFDGEQSVSLSAIDVVPNNANDYPRNFADRNHLSLNLSEINKPSSRNFNIMYKSSQEIEREQKAATKIVSWCKGYLTRRLMKTERVESTVQTIRDALLCALQMHADQDSIQGPDIDLHRRLIQQITAACYTLHDIFIDSTAEDRMRLIRQDRERKMAIMQRSFNLSSSPHHRHLSATTQRVLRRKMDSMSRSHTGAFTSRSSRSSHYPANVMTRSHYEQTDHMRGFSSNKDPTGIKRTLSVAGDSVCRKPWR